MVENSEYPAYIGRMIKEKEDLCEKKSKLISFMTKNDGVFDSLPVIKKELLRSQLSAMETYLNILSIRIDIETSAIKSLSDSYLHQLPIPDDGKYGK